MLDFVTEECHDKIKSVRQQVISEHCLLTLDAGLFICFLLKDKVLTHVTVYNTYGTQSDDIMLWQLLKDTTDNRII
jgi:hypothetical protein